MKYFLMLIQLWVGFLPICASYPKANIWIIPSVESPQVYRNYAQTSKVHLEMARGEVEHIQLVFPSKVNEEYRFTFDRYLNRLDEIEESLKIIEQLIDNIPDGDYLAKTKAIIKLPEGEYYQRVEAGRGEFGVYINSTGDKTPYRLKFRSPSMAAVSAMPLICRDEKISDFIGIGGSMDYVIPDIDR